MLLLLDSQAMTLESPARERAPARRQESSHVLMLDNSVASARAGRPQSLRPFVTTVAVPTYETRQVVTFFVIEVVLIGSAEPVILHRRYSDLLDLKLRLDRVYPNLRLAMGRFPPKSGPRRYDERFLDKRRRRLQEWLSVILLHPVRRHVVPVESSVVETLTLDASPSSLTGSRRLASGPGLAPAAKGQQHPQRLVIGSRSWPSAEGPRPSTCLSRVSRTCIVQPSRSGPPSPQDHTLPSPRSPPSSHDCPLEPPDPAARPGR
jgi:hypothetical protein